MENIEAIQKEHIQQKDNFPALEELNSTSKVSVWRLWVYIISFVANTIKELYEIHKTEVDFLIDNQRITGLKFFREKALEFRKGHSFDRENLVYFVGNYTDEEIEASKIVKRASVEIIKRDGRNVLFVKLATESASGLARIPADELSQIREYMFPLTPAGTNVQYFSGEPDELRLNIDVYVDPLIIDENGELIDASAPSPVPEAINNFLASKGFDFNGELRLSALVDIIQKLKGVRNHSVKIQSAYYSTQIPESWQPIDESYTSSSGYFRIRPEFLTIKYIPKYATE